MHLAFDILRGLGVAAAIGIRPFLPSLAACALASGDVEIDFQRGGFHFLSASWFLLILAICAILLAVAERQLGAERLGSSAARIALAVVAVALGALLFAGIMDQGHYAAWPGAIAGAVCALVGLLATQPLLARVRKRLDAGAQAALPLYAESAGLVLSVASVVVPPVGAIGIVALAWLLVASRRRAGEKYAGLRILR
jgi:hypothetical protein